MSRSLTAQNTTTAVLALTAVAYDPQPTSPGLFRFVSDRASHILVSRAGTDATVADAYVPAGCIEFVRINPGESLSVIKATGETDGNVWFTPSP